MLVYLSVKQQNHLRKIIDLLDPPCLGLLGEGKLCSEECLSGNNFPWVEDRKSPELTGDQPLFGRGRRGNITFILTI